MNSNTALDRWVGNPAPMSGCVSLGTGGSINFFNKGETLGGAISIIAFTLGFIPTKSGCKVNFLFLVDCCCLMLFFCIFVFMYLDILIQF
jgi:hypothetical protein